MHLGTIVHWKTYCIYLVLEYRHTLTFYILTLGACGLFYFCMHGILMALVLCIGCHVSGEELQNGEFFLLDSQKHHSSLLRFPKIVKCEFILPSQM